MNEDDLIIFKDKKHKQKILKEMKKQFMSSPYYWNLNQKYKESNMSKIIKRIQETKATTITLANNYHFNIISQISVCRFPNLVLLNLSNNNIDNLQSLSLMGLDSLEHLYLDNNFITSLHSIKKISVIKLKMLDLSANLLYSIKEVDRINFFDLGVLNLEKNMRLSNIKQYCKSCCDAPTYINTSSINFKSLYFSMNFLDQKVYKKKSFYLH